MATQPRDLLNVIVCGLALSMFSASAMGQSAPPVYVSGGTTIYQYQLKNGKGTLAAILTVSGANFESLAVGPDNADLDSDGNPAHQTLVYACDTANKQIVRFDPTLTAPIPSSKVQQVYSGSSGSIIPVCGRSTATGDFYFTDENGSGIWRLIAVANIKYDGASPPLPAFANVNSDSRTTRGITEKYQGDYLAVDYTNKQVLRFAFPTTSSTTPSSFVSTNLNAPVGIARISTGEVFVSNSIPTSAAPPVAHFAATGSPAATCPSLTFTSDQIPLYVGTASAANANNTFVSDIVYLISSSSHKGTLWSWNTLQGNCTLTAAATINTPLSGVAVVPIPVMLALPVNASVANPTPTPFNFNSNLFQLLATGTGASGSGCTAQITAYPMNPGTVQHMIDLTGTTSNPLANPAPNPLPNGAFPAVNIGEQGYEIIYVAHWLPPLVTGCQPVFPPFYQQGVAAFVDDTSKANLNLRLVQCDSSDTSGNPLLQYQLNEPSMDHSTVCSVTPTLAIYPETGPIAEDYFVGSNSVFAVVNSGLNTTQDKFCGFGSPLLNPGDPGYPASFSSSTRNTIPVNFKLAAAPQDNCKNGPYVTNAQALLSVVQVKDSAGNAVYNPIDVSPTDNSLNEPPVFNSGNQQYSFTLNISGLAKGTYDLNVTFLTNNTTYQLIQFLLQ